MKKSRKGLAVLLIVFLVVAFVALVLTVSLIRRVGEETSAWTDMLDYGNKIGVINIDGAIISSDEALKQLRKYRKKASVKAIVIRINSPGGTVAPAQEIYREIGKIRKKKPVVASFETLAASAAYYLASDCDAIVSSPGTITGSIGVIMMLPDFQKLIDKVGVGMTVIKAGKYKDIGSSVRAPTEEELNILQTFAAEVHEQFINDVALGRQGKIDKEKLRSIADGRFFTGEKAMELGLVDSMGNFYDAVQTAAKLGRIKGEPELIYPKKKWDNVLDVLTESTAETINRVLERLRAVSPAPVIR